jgi:hypothetical protein
MLIELTVMQFVSICMGLGLVCYFWGCWVERRDLANLIDKSVQSAFENYFSQ